MEIWSEGLSRALKKLGAVIPKSVMFKVGLLIILATLFIAAAAPLISPYDPTKATSEILLPPSPSHPMGTNQIGQDVLSRVIYGSRIILLVVFSATLISMAVGIPVGIYSGFIGGKADRVLSMIMDSIYAFPSLILAIAIASVLGPSPLNTAISLAVVYIPTYFRMTRGQTLSLREQLFVEAARSMGASKWHIMRRHIFPNLLPTVLVVFTLSAADAIITEAGLSYLGLSVTPPTPDWGYDLRAGQGYFTIGFWWISFFPGIMIMLLAL
ncbi:MAG: ABC transporter permease, partial [Fervidicoccaceae archaeon]